MFLLEVLDNQGKKRQIPLDRPHVLIGREPSCDIHLAHPAVSRRHAQLQKNEQGRWVLQDLSSRNRVYVDNKPVQQLVLDASQVFRIADYRLSLVDTERQAPSEVDSKHPTPNEDTNDTGVFLEEHFLDSLTSFQRNLVSIEEPQQALELLAQELRRVVRPQVLAIGLRRAEGYAWEIVHTEQDGAPLRDRLQEADNKVADEPSSLLSWPSTPAPQAEQAAGCLLVPLRGRHSILGHAYISRPYRDPLPGATQRYLILACSYAAMAWENLHLTRIRKTHLDFEKELEHARQIQIDLFPSDFDIDPRLDVFGVNLPSARVSGDYYDLIRTGKDTVAFIIADAMGHGLPAALLMAAVRAGLRMGLQLDIPWQDAFRGVDDLIRQARSDTFVTGMVGLLNLREKELFLVSAGHPAPSILVDGVPVAIPECCQTRPWGIDLETGWEVGRLALRGKRWSILCFTDGVTESPAQGQRSFGAHRVTEFHRNNFKLSAEDLCQGLLNDVAAAYGRDTLADDQTVLVLCSS
ncbi:MAG: SpoIIE family protein phosphatase [Gemmataceae bacterium]